MEVARVICINSKGEVLLVEPIKRKGKFELPGGKTKEGETFIAGAIRELYEETGVLVAAENLYQIYRMVDYDFPSIDRIHYSMTCFINTVAVTTKPKPIKKDEIKSLGWFNPRKLNQIKLEYRSRRFILRYQRMIIDGKFKDSCPHQ